MQIRISKSDRRVELLRSKYVPEKKRSTQIMIASFNESDKQVPDGVLEILTPEEQTEVQEWFNKRIAEQQEATAKQKITNFTREINQVVESISRYSITNEQAQDIYKGMDGLAKYLRKVGFTRIKNG